LDNLKKLLKK